jgi:hypothetical protein
MMATTRVMYLDQLRRLGISIDPAKSLYRMRAQVSDSLAHVNTPRVYHDLLQRDFESIERVLTHVVVTPRNQPFLPCATVLQAHVRAAFAVRLYAQAIEVFFPIVSRYSRYSTGAQAGPGRRRAPRGAGSGRAGRSARGDREAPQAPTAVLHVLLRVLAGVRS